LRQTFARRVVQLHLDGRSGASADRRKLSAEDQNAALCRDAATKRSLVFANPDHPWVDTAEGAAVRIAMNAERAAAEKHGVVHWLRPEYQLGKQKAESGKQKGLSLPEGEGEPKAKAKAPKLKRKILKLIYRAATRS
jgi:hypothetical protein